MNTSLILSAMFGIAFSAVSYDPSQAGKTHCTYKGHKIELDKKYYPPGECAQLDCEADSTGKRTKALHKMTCGLVIDLNNKGVQKKSPQNNLNLKYPRCCI